MGMFQLKIKLKRTKSKTNALKKKTWLLIEFKTVVINT